MIETIVIGGGFGGLASAIYSLKQGDKTLLIDSHYSLGGCAGFYRRKGYTFDVGATTLSALDSKSVLKKLLEELEIYPEVFKVDPGIVIHRNGHIIKRFSEKNSWNHELEKRGYSLSSDLWSEMEEIESRGWEFLMRFSALPPKGPVEMLKIITALKLKDYKLIKASITPFRYYLKKYKIEGDLKRIIDEQLLISTQTTSDNTSFLAASMGLSYPAQTYIPFGGMKALVDSFSKRIKELKGKILTRTKVISIRKDNEIFMVTTKNRSGEIQEYKAEQVISNLPIWNMKPTFRSRI